MIPPPDDQPKPAKKPHSGHVHSHAEARKLSVQSSASTGGGGSERKPRRTSRTHQGASLNEVCWKNSKRVFTRINDRKLSMPLANKDVKPNCIKSKALIRNLRGLNFQGETISRKFFQGRFWNHYYLPTKQ